MYVWWEEFSIDRWFVVEDHVSWCVCMYMHGCASVTCGHCGHVLVDELMKELNDIYEKNRQSRAVIAVTCLWTN